MKKVNRMKSLAPVPAHCRNNKELVLIDPEHLNCRTGFPQKAICVGKTYIVSEFSSAWTLFIEEYGVKTCLLRSGECEDVHMYLDIVKALGHNLLIMPWQKLIFESEVDHYPSGVSYIEIVESEPH